MNYNLKTFDYGIKLARRMINNRLYAAIENSCLELIDHALKKREFDGFTGNTMTSYTCGIYLDGKLEGAVVAEDYMKPPIHIKIRKGQKVRLGKPYEGKARTVTGQVKVDSLYGAESAIKFLKSYKPHVKKGFSVVMTTGTEYSEYLENVRNLNVLTDTFQSAKGIVLEELKPMKV